MRSICHSEFGCARSAASAALGTLVRGNHRVTAQDLGERGRRGNLRMTEVTQAPLDLATTVHLTQRQHARNDALRRTRAV